MFLAPNFLESATPPPPPNFWSGIIKLGQIPTMWQSFTAIGRGSSENAWRNKKHLRQNISPSGTVVPGGLKKKTSRAFYKSSRTTVTGGLMKLHTRLPLLYLFYFWLLSWRGWSTSHPVTPCIRPWLYTPNFSSLPSSMPSRRAWTEVECRRPELSCTIFCAC